MKFSILKFLSHLVAGLFIACLLAGPVCLICGGSVYYMQEFGIGLCVAIVPLFLIMTWLVRYREKNYIIDRDDFYSYDRETETLTLHKRCNRSGYAISIEEIKDYNLQYHPSQTVYTGATVGGIHMGGFHQTKDSYTVETFSTRKAKLKYTDDLDSLNHGQIKIIKLDSSLVKDAARSFPEFLTGDCLVLLHEERSTIYQHGFDAAVKTNRTDLLETIAKGAFLEKQLTLDECKDIRNWISGK